MWALVPVPDAPLPTQFPVDAAEKTAEEGQSAWAPVTIGEDQP